MNLYRRLLEWLARKEIRAEVLWERAQCAVGIKFACEAAYLKGHHDGEQEALDKMAHVIFLRSGEPDSMTAEDLANCRKGLTH